MKLEAKLEQMACELAEKNSKLKIENSKVAERQQEKQKASKIQSNVIS